jgi:hypothetical protein
MRGTRDIRLRRESGPDRPLTYRVILLGNDGTFDTAPSVTLPLGGTVTLPVKIRPASPGAHSVLINLVDAASSIVFRTQATVVASEHVDASTGSLRITGKAGLMRMQPHYFHVPAGTGAVSIELEVFRGVVKPTILPAHGLFPGYYLHVHPMNVRFVGRGKHTVVLPDPEPGTWTLQLENTSAGGRFGPPDVVPTDDTDAEYAVTVRLLGASIDARGASPDALALDLRNVGSTIREPIVQVTPATFKSHRGHFNPTGFPNVVEIVVPEGAGTLSLKLRSEQPGTNAVELFLYDCTTGECFSYDLGFPAGPSQTMVVRKPNAGRWVAAVNTAPFPAASGSFILDEIIASGPPVRRASTDPRQPGARWTESIDIGGGLSLSPAGRGQAQTFLVELLDAASERDEVENIWIVGPDPRKLRDRPVALGTAVYRR